MLHNNRMMKVATLVALLFSFVMGNAQSLPIDFETNITIDNFVDFDGGTASIIENPQANGINTSTTVAQIVRDGGEVWAGSKIGLANNLDFTTLNSLSMKVFVTTPVGTTIKFKLEDANGAATERDAQTTVSNEWETLTWDFSGTPTNFNQLVFMFDFGNTGDGSANSTFLFDDVKQFFGGAQIDFPVDFEDDMVNYTMTDFGGTESTLVPDPTDQNNKIIQVVKTAGAADWAGTTIGTNAGFATNLPFSLSDSKMTVRVWSPEAGLTIRLKVEDANDPTHTCETNTTTTVAEAWESLEFDFANEASGTAALETGLNAGWIYNMASIFFDFGMAGDDQTYYFDDVQFGEIALGTPLLAADTFEIYPNPTQEQWTIKSDVEYITSVEVFDLQGKQLLLLTPNEQTTTIPAADLAEGIYLAKVTTRSGSGMVKLMKK
ncbi:MAG: T9SS type A sorting domain-containing protein [Chitinophagales bacterium]